MRSSRLWVAVLLLTATAAGAALGRLPWVGLGLAGAAAVVDAAVPRPDRASGRIVDAVEHAAGRSLRLALRWLIVAGCAVAVLPEGVVTVAAVAASVIVLVVSAVDALDWAVQGLRRLPVGRGVESLSPHPLGGPRPPVLLTLVPELLLGGAAVVLRNSALLVAVAAVVAIGITAATAVAWILRTHRIRSGKKARLRAAQLALDRDRPEVVLYYGDTPASLHEVGMWLATLEALPQRAMVLVRNRAAFDALPQTTATVLCVPAAQDLLALRLDMVRVALFVSNIGDNIHLLRYPGIRSAFIGHGDSDKSASANPFSKVYDEIWVAGPAGRQRYLDADVGVRSEDIVEVGRPQLSLVREGPPSTAQLPTLLYAPTWEGWNREQAYTSVASHGEALVEAVLAFSSPIRILYRPHPYIGRRDPAVAAAHRRIVAMLEAANKRSGWSGPTVVEPQGDASSVGSASETERMAVLNGEQVLASAPPIVHRVVAPGNLPLISCFNAASGLVTDVSSVLTDFLARDEPLAVCDPIGEGPRAFVERFPSAAAGVVLPPGVAGIEAFLETLTGQRDDLSRGARHAARRELLGDPEAQPLDSFARAVDALGARASAARASDPRR